MLIEKVKNITDAQKCNELLTKLIQSEKQYNKNINENYIVENWFEKIFNKKNNVIYVAKEDEQIVGYIYCKVNTIPNGSTKSLEALIDGLYVLEEYRKRGIATLLIQEVKKWAIEKKIKFLTLNVIEKNENAKRLYYKEGFTDFQRELKIEM